MNDSTIHSSVITSLTDWRWHWVTDIDSEWVIAEWVVTLAVTVSVTEWLTEWLTDCETESDTAHTHRVSHLVLLSTTTSS